MWHPGGRPYRDRAARLHEETAISPSLTFPEALVLGAVQGVSELFPVSSLGHAVLIPALIGGSWARDLNAAATDSPYLAFIVALHIATACALIVFYRRDWAALVVGFGSSIRHRRLGTGAERLSWLLIAATVPVAVLGLLFDKLLRTRLAQPVPVACFLILNGLVLAAGWWFERRDARRTPARHVSRPEEAHGHGTDVVSDTALSQLPFRRGIGMGVAQAAALLPGISRSGSVMVAGQAAGLTNREAARFSFLLATPAILAAGVLKLPDLLGPMGRGILGPVLAGSVVAFVAALLSVAFLDRYFAKRSLLPFAAYCVVAGGVSLAVLIAR